MAEYDPWNGGGGDNDDLYRLPGWLDRLISYLMKGICLMIVFGIPGGIAMVSYAKRAGTHATSEDGWTEFISFGVIGVIAVIVYYNKKLNAR